MDQTPLIQICFINDQWVRMSNLYVSDAALLAPRLIKQSFSIQPEQLNNYNICTVHTFTTALTKNSFISIINQTSSSTWFVPQLRQNSIYLHELKKSPSFISKRCNVKLLYDHIKCNSKPLIQNVNTVYNNLCPCTQFSYESLLKTKCSPIGKQNCKNNLQILLQSIGLYTKYQSELTWCSHLSMVSFDIGNILMIIMGFCVI